jgi:hypothetical protein
VSAAVPVTIGNGFCLVRASDSAELNVWPRSADRHGAGALRHLPDLVAELRGNPKRPSE